MKKGLFKRIGSMLLAAALMIPTIAPAVQLVSAEAAQEKPFLVDFGAKGGITSLKKANDIYDTNYVRTNYGDLFGNVNTKFQYGGEQKSRYFYQCSGSGEITLLAPEGNTPKHYDNFTLECDLSFEGGTLDTGIMFRVNESSNVNNPHGYFLGFYNNEIRILDGKDWSIPVRVSFTPDRGRTYHVKLEVQGSSIKGYVDDMTTPIITFNDSRYTSGALGLRNYRGTLSADNITIDGVLVDDFESGTNDKWYAMNGTGWRVADQGESGWQTANTSGRTPEITRPDADT